MNDEKLLRWADEEACKLLAEIDKHLGTRVLSGQRDLVAAALVKAREAGAKQMEQATYFQIRHDGAREALERVLAEWERREKQTLRSHQVRFRTLGDFIRAELEKL